MLWIKQFLCKLAGHCYKSNDAERRYDKATKLYAVTETCCRCGKQKTFSMLTKNYSIEMMDV